MYQDVLMVCIVAAFSSLCELHAMQWRGAGIGLDVWMPFVLVSFAIASVPGPAVPYANL